MSARDVVSDIRALDSAPPGVVVGVASPGRVDIAAGGTADLAATPVSAATAFDLASVTKVAATTSALHRLASDGRMSLDAPVASILPTSPCSPGTTVRSLLQHRSGLWEWQPLYLADDRRDPWPTIEALPLRYTAGEGRHYSDLGFMLLGRVIEAVTGDRLDTAVTELVSAPLGLRRTGYRPADGTVAAGSLGDAAERRMVATNEPYPVLFAERGFPWREHELLGEANDGNCFHAFGGVAGHAGLFSTVEELLALGSSLASAEERPDLWDPAVTADVFADGPDAGQALGWRSESVELDGVPRRLLWHPGYTGCAFGFVPDTGVAVVLLSNRLLADRPEAPDRLWRTALRAVPGLTTSREP